MERKMGTMKRGMTFFEFLCYIKCTAERPADAEWDIPAPRWRAMQAFFLNRVRANDFIEDELAALSHLGFSINSPTVPNL